MVSNSGKSAPTANTKYTYPRQQSLTIRSEHLGPTVISHRLPTHNERHWLARCSLGGRLAANRAAEQSASITKAVDAEQIGGPDNRALVQRVPAKLRHGPQFL